MVAVDQIATLLNTGGVVFLLVAAVVGRYKQFWVDGPTHRTEVADLKADRDFWKDRALTSLDLAARSTHVAETLSTGVAK